jgi:glutathione S-transferase
MQLLGIRFEHRPLSVFTTFSEFKEINPVVKAPTLVCDDGEVLIDSTLILQYVELMGKSERRMLPIGLSDQRSALRMIGLALVACEKSVQIIYERELRPVDKVHAPWLERVTSQLLSAYDTLEEELARRPLAVSGCAIDQAGVSVAVAWQFTQCTLPEIILAKDFPNLKSFSADAETLPEFASAPHGTRMCRPVGK